MLQLMREGGSYTHPPLSIARYSFIQLSELEQCRVTKLAQGFNTAAQDSNPGSLSRESEALPLSHCTLQGRRPLRWKQRKEIWYDGDRSGTRNWGWQQESEDVDRQSNWIGGGRA